MEMVETQNKEKVIWLGIYISSLWSVRQLIQYVEFKLFNKKIIIELNEYFKNKFITNLFLKSNVEWLDCNNPSEINTAINDGTDALIAVLQFSVNVINPIFQAMGVFYIIGNYIHLKIVYVVIAMILILLLGLLLLRWEFHQRQLINKETNPLRTYNVHLANTFLIHLLNGNGTKIRDQILDNSTKNRTKQTEITLLVQNGYTFIEILGNFISPALLYFLCYNEKISIIAAIYISLNNLLGKTWWLFHMFNRASKQAATWASLEPYLIDVVEEEQYYKNNLNNYNINDKTSKEYKINGQSGSGKSTWMKTELIRLFRNFKVCWLYLDQKMVIPKTSCVSIYEFLIDGNYNISQSDIFKWSSQLKLDDVINLETLYKPFASPSGGEEKRIIILQKFLPILLNYKKIKIIFTDEISAGLDHDTQLIVRQFIEILKYQYNIIIVNIDHHKYKTEDLIKLSATKVMDREYPFNIEEIESNYGCCYKKEIEIKKKSMPPLIVLE